MRFKSNKTKIKNKILDTEALQDPRLKEEFQEFINTEKEACDPSEPNDIKERSKRLYNVIDNAISQKFSTLSKPNNVWVSQETIQISVASINA